VNPVTIKLILPLMLAAWTFQDVALPGHIRAQIDALHKDWRLARVLPEVEAEIRTRTPSWPPNLILGDFDGNKQTDAAVLVEYADAAVGGGRAVQLLAFLGDGEAFTMFVLEKPAPHDSRQFLHLVRENGGDAIGVEFEAIGGHEWSYRRGEWRSRTAQ
jgi:hypothetical protein